MSIQEKMNAYKQGFIDGKNELQQENAQLKSDMQALRERLKEIEWSELLMEVKFCPACISLEKDGHKEDCWLKKQIAELYKLKGVE